MGQVAGVGYGPGGLYVEGIRVPVYPGCLGYGSRCRTGNLRSQSPALYLLRYPAVNRGCVLSNNPGWYNIYDLLVTHLCVGAGTGLEPATAWESGRPMCSTY